MFRLEDTSFRARGYKDVIKVIQLALQIRFIVKMYKLSAVCNEKHKTKLTAIQQ